MIGTAAEQLRRKSASDRARVVVLIAHLLDHMYAEVLATFVAHHLEPLTAAYTGPPGRLVRGGEPLTNLLYNGDGTPDQPPSPGAGDRLEFLTAVDIEFRPGRHP
ncbi:hypothetical protein ACWED2_01650 [Amycolatopsis sp. NPDC005003]